MPNSRRITSRAIGKYTPPAPPVSCAYPLSATLAELQATFGPSALRMALSEGDQLAQFTITAGMSAAGVSAYVAPPDWPMGSPTLDFSAGKKAIQFLMTVPLMPAATSWPNLVSASVVSMSTGLAVTVDFQQTEADKSLYELVVRTGAGGEHVQTFAAGASNTTVVTLEFDAVAGTVGVRLAGTLLSVTEDAYTPGEYLVYMGSNYYHENDADAGKAFSIQLVANAADMVPGISLGFTDPCGNELPPT